MRWLFAVVGLAVGGGSGFAIGMNSAVSEHDGPNAPWGEGPPEVSNAFWKEVARGSSGSSVDPESNCKEIGRREFRCYARWAPTGQPEVFTYEGTVNIYPDGRVIVSDLNRTAETQSGSGVD